MLSSGWVLFNGLLLLGCEMLGGEPNYAAYSLIKLLVVQTGLKKRLFSYRRLKRVSMAFSLQLVALKLGHRHVPDIR